MRGGSSALGLPSVSGVGLRGCRLRRLAPRRPAAPWPHRRRFRLRRRSSAIGVLTSTPRCLRAITIFATVPSSTASTSIVALSVSISAITSPDLTASPTFTATWPSCPRSSSATAPASGLGIGMYQAPTSTSVHSSDGIGLRTVLREFGRFVDDLRGSRHRLAFSAASSAHPLPAAACAPARSGRARRASSSTSSLVRYLAGSDIEWPR